MTIGVLCAGSFAVADDFSCSAALPIRVGTWNVNGLRGGQTTADSLRTTLLPRVDLAAIQETDARASILKAIGAEGSGWHEVRFSSNAILSRWPIRASGAVEVSTQPPRHLPWADVEHPGGCVVRIYSIHLSYKRGANPLIGDLRAAESRMLLRHAAVFDGPVILAGDLNSMGWLAGGHGSEPSVRLIREAGFADAGETSPGGTHQFLGKIDWILVRGQVPGVSVRGSYDGSDHRWLTAELGSGGSARQNAILASLQPNLEPGAWAVLALLGTLFGTLAKLAFRRIARAMRRPGSGPPLSPQPVSPQPAVVPLPIATVAGE